MILVTNPVEYEGFQRDEAVVQATIASILNNGNPRFLERPEAEQSLTVQQVVPYAVLQDSQDRYFFAQRRADLKRKELRGRYTILVGGHAEEKDWEPGAPDNVFEACLRRELEEELIGTSILGLERLGIVNDPRTPVGTHHLGIVYRVKVGGRTKIRRQASDQEFGRESVSWVEPDQIRESVANLDPWSQLIAESLFGAKPPPLPGEPSLFTRNNNQGD